LKILAKEVIVRLLYEEGWTKPQEVLAKISKIFVILIIFMSMKIEFLEFVIGVVIFSLGTIGFIAAILSFKNAALACMQK